MTNTKDSTHVVLAVADTEDSTLVDQTAPTLQNP
jgi:hypothetical protein